jgi:hypothetical protein
MGGEEEAQAVVGGCDGFVAAEAERGGGDYGFEQAGLVVDFGGRENGRAGGTGAGPGDGKAAGVGPDGADGEGFFAVAVDPVRAEEAEGVGFAGGEEVVVVLGQAARVHGFSGLTAGTFIVEIADGHGFLRSGPGCGPEYGPGRAARAIEKFIRRTILRG